MCGICGKLNFDLGSKVRPELLRGMLDSIRHRGPDEEGIHLSGNAGLGHCRLSIIDLATGQQPLANEDGSVWVVFNGEIYNFALLRETLLARGHVFKTRSDTEVIVHLYEEYGEACVDHLRGMFAFAIWDNRRKLLFLARDRVGIKPLYYRLTDRSLVFASEIKAILADPEVDAAIDPQMIDKFLTFFYMPGEETLFRGIRKLAAGHYMVVQQGRPVRTVQYWDLKYVDSGLSFPEAQERLGELLAEVVGSHMISDVPVGFLLSGGVDSTAMLGLAVGKSEYPLSSYTLGFDAPGITDERPYARLAAKTYGSRHHEMTMTCSEFVDFLPKYVWHMEEPICEPPAIALYYVSKLASKYVKVLISGEGGDEAFGGYPNYRNLLWLERMKTLFGPFKALLGAGVSTAGHVLRSERILKYRALLDTPFESYYYSRTSSPFRFFNARRSDLYSTDFALMADKTRSVSATGRYLLDRDNTDLVNRMLYVDTKTWLTDDLLVKADKMTMANSVELRVPLLDHKVLEFAASLPGKYKVKGRTTKLIAKKTLESRVPAEILNRKKTGFPVPYESWLRGEIKDWMQDVLLDRETLSRGYFKKSGIEQLIADNGATGRYSKELFSLVTLELLHRQFLGARQELPLVHA